MLVLSRKKDQQIAIASLEIVITVVEIRGDKVRLGFQAAKDISIHRMEVFDAIQKKLAVDVGVSTV
jgi:carbon storage regulator